MKKIISLLLASIVLLSLLVGCGDYYHPGADSHVSTTPGDQSNESPDQTDDTPFEEDQTTPNNAETTPGYTETTPDAGETTPENTDNTPEEEACEHFVFRLSADKTYYEISQNSKCWHTRIDGIPAMHDGLPVKAVARYGFKSNQILQEIIIPDTIEYIGESAFDSCKGLTFVSLPSGLEYIDSKVFKNCLNLKNIVLSASVKEIRDSAFYGCSLESFDFLAGVEKIGKEAFVHSTKLKSIVIPESVKEIGNGAFGGCVFAEVINRSSLNIVAGSDDFGCVAQYAIEVHTGETKLKREGDFLMYTGDDVHLVDYYGESSEVQLPGKYNGKDYGIFVKAFSEDDISSVVFSDAVSHIEERAFYSCKKLKSITFSNSFNDIGGYAFASCVALEELNLPSTVTLVNNGAFENCTGLKKAIIAGVQRIDESAFAYCASLAEVVFSSDLIEIGIGAFQNCVALEQLDLPSSLTAIGARAFQGCSSLKELNITVDKMTLGDNEFAKCANLEKVVLNINEFTVDGNPFKECAALKQMLINGDLLALHRYAFCDMESLEKLEIIGKSIDISEEIDFLDEDEYPFDNCPNVKELIVLSEVLPPEDHTTRDPKFEHLEKVTINASAWNWIIGSAENIKELEFYGDSSDPEMQHSLWLMNFTSVETVILRDIKNFFREAFSDCSNLKRIEFFTSVEYLPGQLFYNCDMSQIYVQFHGTVEEWNSIPKSNDWNSYQKFVVHCDDGDVIVNS